MTEFAYMRISTTDGRQTTRSQRSSLVTAGATDFRTEHISGTKPYRARPILSALVDEAVEGDTIWVYDLSRLSRGLTDLLEIATVLQDKKVHVRTIQSGEIEIGTPMGMLTLSLMGSIHQFEIALLREKTRQGVAAARTAGRIPGRRAKLNKAQVAQVKVLRDGGMSIAGIGKVMGGVSRPTVYRALEPGYKAVA
jgi:putative DNA-invertase from lambdoid prophage Rac